MKKIHTALLTAGCALALLGAGCAPGGGSGDQTTQEGTVNGFLSAVENGNKAEAKSFVSPDSDLYENFDDAWKEVTTEIHLKGHTILSVDGNDVRVDLEIEENGKTSTDGETFNVSEDGGKWWIDDL